jgi:hypothetical protein
MSLRRNQRARGALAAACSLLLYAAAARVYAQEPPVLMITPPESKAVHFTAQSLDDFIAWAGRSNDQDRELVRAYLLRAAPADWSIELLYEKFQKARAANFDGALVVLSLLGELRNPKSIGIFQRIIWEQPAADERLEDGGLTARDTQEMLQSKAVEGLAYIQSIESLGAALEVAAKHPGQAVRSAAADAFLFNAGDSDDARARLLKALAPDERYMADRARKSADVSVDEFNKRLALFYERHPELIAEPPGEPTAPAPDAPDKDPGAAPPSSGQKR